MISGLMGSSDEPGREQIDDPPRPSGPKYRSAVPAGEAQRVSDLLRPSWHRCGNAGTDESRRPGLHKVTVLQLPPDQCRSAPRGDRGWPPSRAAPDGEGGLEAIYKRPRTSQPHPQRPVYPYLRRNRVIGNWMALCNTERPHSSLERKTPGVAYWAGRGLKLAA